MRGPFVAIARAASRGPCGGRGPPARRTGPPASSSEPSLASAIAPPDRAAGSPRYPGREQGRGVHAPPHSLFGTPLGLPTLGVRGLGAGTQTRKHQIWARRQLRVRGQGAGGHPGRALGNPGLGMATGSAAIPGRGLSQVPGKGRGAGQLARAERGWGRCWGAGRQGPGRRRRARRAGAEQLYRRLGPADFAP